MRILFRSCFRTLAVILVFVLLLLFFLNYEGFELCSPSQWSNISYLTVYHRLAVLLREEWREKTG